MKALDCGPSSGRWGQRVMRSVTGYVHLYVCRRCDRLCLRDPDLRGSRAEALRIDSGEEATWLRTFQASRSELPRMYCRVCGLATGAFSTVDEVHDGETDALVGIAARYERLDGQTIVFTLRRDDASADLLLTPIEHVRHVRSLLCWLVSHPLPARGHLKTLRAHDLLDEVVQMDRVAAGPRLRLDAEYTQRVEAHFVVQGHPLWGEPLQLSVIALEEDGSLPTAALIYTQLHDIIPALLRRHIVGSRPTRPLA